MKIHNLEVTNIASLRGKHQINFNDLFESSSLFAITGKTGAGKSTILNSISLALYGEVYKKGSQNQDFVCLGESFGEIQLTFSTLNTTYKSSWKLRVKKKSGENLKTPKVSRLLFQKIDGNFTAIDKTIDQITNLNFSQFCKTTILNQGEFSRFLMSNFTDRKDILEKFYAGDNLGNLNIKLRDKLKSTSGLLNEKLNTVKTLKETITDAETTQEGLSELTTQYEQETRTLAIFEKANTNINDFVTNATNLLRYQENKTQIHEKLNIQTKSKNILKSEQHSLQEDYDKKALLIKKRKPILDECIKAEIKLKSLTTQKSSLSDSINKISSDIELIKLKIEKSKTDLNLEHVKQKEILKLHPRASEYDLAEMSENFSRADKDFELQRESKLSLESLSAKKKLLTSEIQKAQGILQSLKLEHGKSSEKSPYEDINNIEKEKSSVLAFQLEFKHALSNKFHHLKTIESLKEKLEVNLVSLEKIKSQQQQTQIEITTAQRALDYFKLNEAIKVCLDESHKTGHCVVCDADINEKVIQKQTNSQEFEQIDNTMKTKLLLKDEQGSQFEKHKNQITNIERDIKELSQKISIEHEKIKEKWFTFTHFPVLENVLKEQSQEIITKYVTQLAEQYSILIKEKEALTQIENSIKINSNNLEMHTNKLIECKKEALIASEKNNALCESFNSIIERYDISLEDTLEEKRIRLLELKEVCINLSNINTRKAQLSKELTLLTDNLKNLEQIHQTSIQESQQLSSLINKQEVYIKANSTGAPSIELKEISLASEESQNLLQLKKDEFRNIEIICAELNSKYNNYTETITQTETLLETIKTKIDVLREEYSLINPLEKVEHSNLIKFLTKISSIENNKDITTEILTSSFESFKQHYKVFSHSVITLKEEETSYRVKYNQKVENETKVNSILESISEKQHEYDLLENLNQLLGKDEFRNYVLAIIESRLINQTNNELRSICNGRYNIIQTNKHNKMASEFKIVDHFNDSQERKVSTLSGGETFLVSLAMAMALAELTRGSAQIDSLFIDEGFGTLDGESIDEVFELLTTIQHSGKQIGIISHIQDLTNRIPVNIHLEKNNIGNSQVNIIHN